MEEKQLKTIKQTADELLKKMGFQAETEITTESQEGEESVICNVVTTEDSNLMIGQYGVNLQALQHILRLLLRKKISEKIKFILDINSYRQQKNQSIIEQARLAAEQALNEGRSIVMHPMSAYERRLVHMELSQNDRVVTESIGEGESRKVVVKPSKSV